MRPSLSIPAAEPSQRSKRSKRSKRVGYDRRAFAWLLNTPALLAICVLSAFPIAYSAWISLHRYNLQRPHAFKFVGISNYVDILQSPEFWTSLWITVEYTVLVVMLVVVLGILIALLLNREFPGRALVRTLVLLPWAIPPVVNGLMWQWIYDAKVGALNGLLVSLGLLDQYRGWLSSPTSALLALVFSEVWSLLPLAVILLLSALQRIPAELYEAARMDGASKSQLFRYITLPWLSQSLLVVLILQTMSALRAFDVIYVLTAGGPGTATTTLTWQTYLTTFSNLDFGHGNAYAWLVSLITLALALAYFRVLYGRGDIEA